MAATAKPAFNWVLPPDAAAHLANGLVLSHPSAVDTVNVDKTGHGKGGMFVKGNKCARTKRLRPGNFGRLYAPSEISKDYKTFAKWGKRYSKARRQELALAYGKLSMGVQTLVETAALAYAASRYMHWQIEREVNVDKRATMLNQVLRLDRSARACEVAAFNMAALESKTPLAASPEQTLADALVDPPGPQPTTVDLAVALADVDPVDPANNPLSWTPDQTASALAAAVDPAVADLMPKPPAPPRKRKKHITSTDLTDWPDTFV